VNVIQRKVKESEVGKQAKALKNRIILGVGRNGQNYGPRELDGVVLKEGDEIIYIG
jgi:hypothetical protein